MDTETNLDFYRMATEVIRFSHDQRGLLGVGTNGAMPQSIYGFHFQAEIVAGEDSSIVENYWLKADLNFRHSTLDSRSETVLFFPDHGSFEGVCREVVETMSGYPRSDYINQPGVMAFRNSSQIIHDPHEESGPVSGIRIVILQDMKDHLTLAVLSGRNGKDRIATIDGAFGQAEVQDLVARFEAMAAYREKVIAEIRADRTAAATEEVPQKAAATEKFEWRPSYVADLPEPPVTRRFDIPDELP